MMDVFYGKSGLAQTKINSMEGQFPGREGNGTFAVFNVCEALFLRGGNDSAVGNQASSGIMKGRVDSQSMHHYSSFLASTGRKRKRRRTDRHLGLADFSLPLVGEGWMGGHHSLARLPLHSHPSPPPQGERFGPVALTLPARRNVTILAPPVPPILAARAPGNRDGLGGRRFGNSFCKAHRDRAIGAAPSRASAADSSAHTDPQLACQQRRRCAPVPCCW